MAALKIREAAGAIFEGEVQRIRDDEVSVIVEKWQHRRGYLSTTPSFAYNSSNFTLMFHQC